MKTNSFYTSYFQRYKISSRTKKPVRSQNFASGDEFLINRMPLMCSFAYVVAKNSGYSENLAKSLGYAVAVYYAILKNVSLRSFGGIPSKAHLKRDKTLDDILIEKEEISKVKYLNFCGGTFVLDGERVLGIATIRGRQGGFETWRFDDQIAKIKAIKKDAFEKVCQFWQDVLKNYDLEEVKNGRLYFQIWKKYRDYLRSKSFFLGRK